MREALAPSGRRLLDAASGAIQFDDYVRFSQGYEKRVCVDLSLRGLRAARARIGGHGLFVKADVTALPFARDAFDGVVSLHTLYHVPAAEQATFLGEIARVLAEGARAVVVSNWEGSPWDRALRLPARIARRARRLLGAGPPPTPVAPPSTASLYYHPTRRDWLPGAIPASVTLRMGCWRSASVDFLRGLGDSGLTRGILRLLSTLEDLWPTWTGRWGAYPLLVLDKPTSGAPRPQRDAI